MFISNFVINGITIGIGRIFDEMAIVLDFSKSGICDAIDNEDEKLLDALKSLRLKSLEIDAIQTFGNNFEYYFTQGAGWEWGLEAHSFTELSEYKKMADLVLSSDIVDAVAIKSANIFLQALEGNYPEYIPTEMELNYKKQEKYQRQRAKWLKILIEKNGYKCHICEIDKDLCIKHLVSIMKGGETELENLQLRCKKCINKK